MASFSRKRYRQLKKTYDYGIVLLMEDFKKLWTYDEDAIALAEALEIPVSNNSKGLPFLSQSASDIMSRYDLEEIDNEDGAFFLPYEDDEEFPDEDKVLPPSTWLVAKLDSADGAFIMIVVEDPKEVNIGERIYRKSHPFAEALIEADILFRRSFGCMGAVYSIRSLYRTDAYETYLEKQRHFLDLESLPKPINVYKSKSYTKDNSLTQTTALVFFSRKEQPVKMNVWYSSERDEYFINLQTFNSYRKQFGMPFIHAKEAPGEHIFGALKLAEQSIFNLYGYNVSKEQGLTPQERQEILTHMIDYMIVTKGDVMNFLEGMISLNESNPQMCLAIEKWREDLYYISTYDMKGPPDFWGMPRFRF